MEEIATLTCFEEKISIPLSQIQSQMCSLWLNGELSKVLRKRNDEK